MARRTRLVSAAVRRIEAARARQETKAWVVKRRDRTRHLIELGGLVQKARLVELTADDRAVLLGAFLTLADQMQEHDRESTLALWRRRGFHAFAEGKSQD